MTTSSTTTTMADSSMESLMTSLGERHLMPGWRRREPSVWPQPTPRMLPAVWRYGAARSALLEVGGLVTTESVDDARIYAERRNLVMVNPARGNIYGTSRNLVAAYQLIMPGERARTHRHSPSALRLALDIAPGTYTVVEGVRIEMTDGDVVLTPNWCWHDHGNDGDGPTFWIDFLDVPFVQHVEAMFLEWHPDEFQEITRTSLDSPFRHTPSVLLPEDNEGVYDIAAPGMPTIGLQFHRRRAGELIVHPKSTVNSLYVVIDGAVRFNVEDRVLDEVLEPGDLISVPCWHAHELRVEEDSLLLRASDEPLMRMTGYLREDGREVVLGYEL